MCDFSLKYQASRDAKVGDCLVTSSFPMTYTLGFTAVGDPYAAVCLKPGTELEFERPVWQTGFRGILQMMLSMMRGYNIRQRVATFTQVELEDPYTHHDAIEFPDGRVIKLTDLREEQYARVVQMPVNRAPRVLPSNTATTRPTEIYEV